MGLDMYGAEAPLSENACILNYNETEAGYLAGYAAVAEGYEQLGFLGDMAVPSMIRYGYGFMQGTDAAAADFARENVCLRYTYCNNFNSEDNAKLTVNDWYGSGTQVVLACSDSTAAAVCYVLTAIESGAWTGLGGKITELDCSFVGLPTDEWRFTHFTREDYENLLSDLRSGKKVVSSDFEAAPEASSDSGRTNLMQRTVTSRQVGCSCAGTTTVFRPRLHSCPLSSSSYRRTASATRRCF